MILCSCLITKLFIESKNHVNKFKLCNNSKKAVAYKFLYWWYKSSLAQFHHFYNNNKTSNTAAGLSVSVYLCSVGNKANLISNELFNQTPFCHNDSNMHGSICVHSKRWFSIFKTTAGYHLMAASGLYHCSSMQSFSHEKQNIMQHFLI